MKVGATAFICTKTFGQMNRQRSDKVAFGAGPNACNKGIGKYRIHEFDAIGCFLDGAPDISPLRGNLLSYCANFRIDPQPTALLRDGRTKQGQFDNTKLLCAKSLAQGSELAVLYPRQDLGVIPSNGTLPFVPGKRQDTRDIRNR